MAEPADERFMGEAIELWRDATRGGDRPIAALIVADGTVHARGGQYRRVDGQSAGPRETVAVDEAVSTATVSSGPADCPSTRRY